MNAIMHRSYESNAPVQFYWYEDRIDIQNPGGLYGMASLENFPRQTDYRNPVIAEAMATLGYVNHFGRGVIRAQEALRRNGNPEVHEWRKEWKDRVDRWPDGSSLSLPSADIAPAGYVVMQHAVRAGRPVQAYQKWLHGSKHSFYGSYGWG